MVSANVVLKEARALLGVDENAAKPCLQAPHQMGYGILFGDGRGKTRKGAIL
jgi:hypothetical protein